MSPSTILAISAVLLLSTATSAFNVTRILNQYPDFSEFNGLLTKTGLFADINSRAAITVLALTNDHIAELAGKPEDVQKRLLSTHIVLDYYDILKLNKLRDTKTILTTLYQSTGVADDMQGFLDVIHKADGSIVFGSAMKGAPHDIKVLGSVASQPYNISVLSISKPIFAPGIDGSYKPVSAPPPKAAAAPANKVPPPAVAESPEEEVADAPAEADGPVASDAPANAPAADAPADAPVADGPSADANDQPKPKSAAGKHVISGMSLGFVVALASLLVIH
ncbi:fasciclin-like arabinogalactan protein 3 [Primulina tabacum]|uniref:fasciclin-like arabinogalactan protein 3 n=1 Tax=Primulina tabacum TaxID=48773 RepID=UPI003F5917D4